MSDKFAYPDSALRFIHTRFYKPYQFHGDTILSENIIQDLPPNWIINVIESL